MRSVINFSSARTLIRVPFFGPTLKAGSSPAAIHARTARSPTDIARAACFTVMASWTFIIRPRLPTGANRCKHFFACCRKKHWAYTPFDNYWQLLNCSGVIVTPMKTKKPSRLVGQRKSVFANITDKTHARLLRRAPAANLSSAKYTGVALEFYMELEDAFGGPLTEQFRAMILRQVGGIAAKVEKALQ